MTPEELVNEMKATRKMLSLFLQKMAQIEAKFDDFTTERNEYRKSEQARRREATWQ